MEDEEKLRKLDEKKEPGTGLSLFVFLGSVAILLFGVVVFGFDIHIVLLCALGFVCLVSWQLGYSFNDLVECMKKPLGQSMAAMIIFIFIGIIIASWICSGTVPVLVLYGLRIMTPQIFLPAGFVLCCITSFSIGTSWGTIGTMGIVMMGIGSGMGIPAPVTAGMVISGAAFGDKMSPMSDTTNLAPAASGATLYEHIASMWKVTAPSWVISLCVFTVLGSQYGGSGMNYEVIEIFEETIGNVFKITPIVLIPLIVLLLWNVLRFPAIPGMAFGALLAVIIACTVQGMPLKDVLNALNYGYANATGVEIVDTLLLRGGIQNMMYTFSLSCIAISFGGVLEHVGYLKKIIHILVGHIKNDRLMVPVVIASTFIATLTMGEVYLAIVLVGNLYKNNFKERGLKPQLLSRLLEEGGTLMQYFIPWSTTGVFVAGTLGVTVFEYSRYAILNIMNPLLSVVLAMFGIFVLRETKGNQEN